MTGLDNPQVSTQHEPGVAGGSLYEPQIQNGSIRSFVLRQGRLTPGQKQALADAMGAFGLDAEKPLNPDQAFASMGQVSPGQLVVEIGFGNGGSLIEMAKASPDTRFIGIEVHKPGVGAILQSIVHNDLKNIRVYLADAHLVLSKALEHVKVDRFQLYFPDPWPKKRHHKRRFVRAEMMTLLCERLRNGGVFHMATDWANYAEEALEFLNDWPDLENVEATQGFVKRPDWRPLTKFESRGIKLGHGVWDLLFRKRLAE